MATSPAYSLACRLPRFFIQSQQQRLVHKDAADTLKDILKNGANHAGALEPHFDAGYPMEVAKPNLLLWSFVYSSKIWPLSMTGQPDNARTTPVTPTNLTRRSKSPTNHSYNDSCRGSRVSRRARRHRRCPWRKNLIIRSYSESSWTPSHQPPRESTLEYSPDSKTILRTRGLKHFRSKKDEEGHTSKKRLSHLTPTKFGTKGIGGYRIAFASPGLSELKFDRGSASRINGERIEWNYKVALDGALNNRENNHDIIP